MTFAEAFKALRELAGDRYYTLSVRATRHGWDHDGEASVRWVAHLGASALRAGDLILTGDHPTPEAALGEIRNRLGKADPGPTTLEVIGDPSEVTS